MDDIKIKQLTFARGVTELCYIREQVFIKEQNVPPALEWDGLDQDAIHLLALSAEQQPIGTVRMLKDGHIGRMAVLSEWRNQGIGSQLLMHILDIAREHKLMQVFLAAQTTAIGFYARYGFSADDKVFMDAGIAHQNMILKLNK